jgi:hypothetical protein
LEDHSFWEKVGRLGWLFLCLYFCLHKEGGIDMVLDTGTMLAIIIALAGSCFVMVVGIRAQGQLHRVINKKNEKIRFLEAEISKQKRKQLTNESR